MTHSEGKKFIMELGALCCLLWIEDSCCFVCTLGTLRNLTQITPPRTQTA